jgi:hypothetical protein
MQCLWTLLKGKKRFQAHQPKASSFYHHPFIRTTNTRAKNLSGKIRGNFSWCYLCSCGSHTCWIVPRRWKMQRYRWSRRLQWMPSIQQQSLQERAFHSVPGQTTSLDDPIAKRATRRCAFPYRRCFSQHPSAKHNCSRGLSELWYYHYSIMEKRREWSYDLQCLWYVFCSETNSPPPMLTLPRAVLQTPRGAPPRDDEEIGHKKAKASGPSSARQPSLRH